MLQVICHGAVTLIHLQYNFLWYWSWYEWYMLEFWYWSRSEAFRSHMEEKVAILQLSATKMYLKVSKSTHHAAAWPLSIK